MTRPIAQLEYEQMLLSRHANATHRKDAGLGRSAYLILSRIEIQGAMTISELSDVLGLDLSTLQRQTAAAIKAGVLERIPDPDGGMARRFIASETGLSLLQSERARFVDALSSALSDWTDEEVTDFARSLKRFNESIERAGALVWPRSAG